MRFWGTTDPGNKVVTQFDFYPIADFRIWSGVSLTTMASVTLPINAMTVPRCRTSSRNSVIALSRLAIWLARFHRCILPMLPLLVSSSWRSIFVSVEGISAAKLAVILAGESPANRGCPVAVVVISSNGKGDRPVESLEVKAPGGQPEYRSDPYRGASNLAGRSECAN